jgi:outer membrane biosynthesis protein TonB
MWRTLLIVLLTACGGGEDKASSSGGAAVTTSDAGKVRELTGKVTATRGTEVRTLAVGNPVAPDDLIDTGGDGSVVIELAHNRALWSLESGIKARVDQSVAWGLSAQDAAKPVDHATSSAGRHADREAANTAVSAIEQDPAKDDAKAAPPAAAQPTTKPVPRPRADPKSVGGGGGGCDEVSCLMNEGASACCAKFKKASSARPAPSSAPEAAGLPESLSRTDISSAMNQLKPTILACGKSIDAKGVLKIFIKVGGDGKVSNAEVKQSPDPSIDACVIDAVKKQPFAKSRTGVTFSYPIVF